MEQKIHPNNKKAINFILITCLTLLLGATACNNEDFGIDLPEQEKNYTKQELIEQAMSRVPMTKAFAGTTSISMVTINKTVTFTCLAIDSITVKWKDGEEETSRSREFTHTYSDEYPSWLITITGSEKAIKTLAIQNNGLIYLEVTAPNLLYFDCSGNHLDEVLLNKCSGLSTLNVENNGLSAINLKNCPNLIALRANNNRLKTIDLSPTPALSTLEIGGSKITDLDLTQNPELTTLSLYDLPLKTINGQAISDTSFFCFPNLLDFDISGTPFTSLDISDNLRLRTLNIAYSDIETLTYTQTSLHNLKELHIERTPLEDRINEMNSLVDALRDWSKPNDYGTIEEGCFYSYSQLLVDSHFNLSELKNKNWLINPSTTSL